MRTKPTPLFVLVRPDGAKVSKWAHRVELQPSRPHRSTRVDCRDCEFTGRYPNRGHARAVADEHMIHTHVTGSEFCDSIAHNGTPRPRTACDGCAAIKRKALRTPE